MVDQVVLRVVRGAGGGAVRRTTLYVYALRLYGFNPGACCVSHSYIYVTKGSIPRDRPSGRSRPTRRSVPSSASALLRLSISALSGTH